ncbi:argininosuccinate lyase [Candidatus Roizmanbacteria bacterium CG_4_10_14_0_8_um_filter_33_9]|uniref:Argininosuccinate lyase n=1 Tax=Candidatus Roizmanbacteria bacterium CG_4_10_14_0_8_um_filter_33_9 TaxID=1974826 RepID=A0A2M7QIY5_9BACT|nr:MAG: argininosuccinate lyase [Candidatus Roizmanbacteria bacterium CG_4_10_14_0_8_um_filter_33_9]
MKTNTIYGGIYKKDPSINTKQFIMNPEMLNIENRFVVYYLWETIAHNLMIAKVGIIKRSTAKKILTELIKILKEVKIKNIINPILGDVHENIENKLTQTIGPEAGWFHVARSRNDQSITDQKLFTKKQIIETCKNLIDLERTLLFKSNLYFEVLMPGYTHMQPAMPSTYGFWLQAYLDQIIKIHLSLISVFNSIDFCPLGAGASYGVNWKINPKFTSALLGFSNPMENSLSAVNSRGIDDAMVISQLTTLSIVFSRMMEDIMIWSLPQLDFIKVDEALTTGSSIMPQKMNLDIVEKIRSKSSLLIANLNHVLIALKGTSSGYNRDSAESKIAIVKSLEEIITTIFMTKEVIKNILPNTNKMKSDTTLTLSTKFADNLSKKYHIPFRISHKIVGKILAKTNSDVCLITPLLVNQVINEYINSKLNINQSFIKNTFDLNQALDHYNYLGSPNSNYLLKVNKKLSNKITYLSNWYNKQNTFFKNIEKKLIKEVIKFVNK